MSWVLRRWSILTVCVLAGAVGFFVTWTVHREMRLIISFDFAAFAYLALFVTLMNVATQQYAAEWASRVDPSGILLGTLVILLSGISIIGVGVLHQPGNEKAKIVYLAASLAAICFAWLLVHIRFGLYYMKMYYDDTVPDDKQAYDEGLQVPERKIPDYWDFMYYSFTIAMCYQTSDEGLAETAYLWDARAIGQSNRVVAFDAGR